MECGEMGKLITLSFVFPNLPIVCFSVGLGVEGLPTLVSYCLNCNFLQYLPMWVISFIHDARSINKYEIFLKYTKNLPGKQLWM